MKNTKMYIGILGAALLTFGVSCKGKEKKDTTEDAMVEEVESTAEDTSAEEVAEAKEVTVVMASKSGSEVKGTVTFTEVEGVVTMVANFEGLEPGEHAIHLHEKADCSADDATSTGGHWNPTFAQHGKWGDEEGFHLGDIGNFTADENGNGSITFETDLWCMDCGIETKNIMGKAVIVHKGQDDFVSQPSGAAGARVSCGGVIE